jgi:putative ABC transport system substrate-binding protein
MERRAVLVVLACAVIAAAVPALGQDRKIPLVGFVNSQSIDGWQHFVAAFERGLADGGLAKGESVAVEYRWAEGRYDRLPALIDDLIALRASILVVTGGPDPALAAKHATSTIPIVFTTGSDPVKLGLVQSLARPGGNITGFTLFTRQLNPKRLELLREFVTDGVVVGALLNPGNSGSPGQLNELATSAAASRIEIRPYYAGSLADVERAFADMKAAGVRAILVASDAFFYANRGALAARAQQTGLPAIFGARDFALAGGLMSYGVDFADVYRRAGVAAARILMGARPADLPIEQPTKFELVVNLKAATALGLSIPASILIRADEVIE